MRNGDEVICFDPTMTVTPRHRAFWGNSEAYGTQPPHFRVDWQEFAALLSERTDW